MTPTEVPVGPESTPEPYTRTNARQQQLTGVTDGATDLERRHGDVESDTFVGSKVWGDTRVPP